MFGKNPEKAQRKREELEKKRKQIEKQKSKLKQKRLSKKNTSKRISKNAEQKTITPKKSQQNVNALVPKTSPNQISKGLARPNRNKNVVKHEPILSLAERIEQRKVDNISENQLDRELISRLSQDDFDLILNNLQEASDIFVFYQMTSVYIKPEILVALGCISKSERYLFDYIISNNLSDQLSKGKINLFDNDELANYKQAYEDYLNRHPEVKDSFLTNEVKEVKLPKIYILGQQHDYDIVKAMSLNTPVFPILSMSDLQIFEEDLDKKIVIMFKNPNGELGKPFKEIRQSQEFSLYLTFQRGTIKAENEITPFNRENLLKKLRR